MLSLVSTRLVSPSGDAWRRFGLRRPGLRILHRGQQPEIILRGLTVLTADARRARAGHHLRLELVAHLLPRAQPLGRLDRGGPRRPRDALAHQVSPGAEAQLLDRQPAQPLLVDEQRAAPRHGYLAVG